MFAAPAVSYFYDGTGMPAGTNVPAAAQGQLTAVKSAVSETIYTGFDAMGRVRQSRQVTDAQSYTLSYEYDLAGNLTRETYPSGRVIETAYDAAGRLNAVTGQAAGGSPKTYADSASYAAHGALRALKLGNNLWEHTSYNSRLQPEHIGLGTTSTDSGVLALDYSYGVTDNNGNVRRQTITLPGQTLVQSYEYDAVNRLQSAREVHGQTETWQQVFTYLDEDGQHGQFGNRRLSAANTPWLMTENPQFNPNNNRIVAQAGQQYAYDSVGNLTTDQGGHTYAYDGDNRLTTYHGGASSNGGATYSYDGDGRRVRKQVGGVVTVFVYNARGQLVAEYGSAQAAQNGTRYLTADHLGTPRVVTGADGLVVARHDYLPFGEEIGAGIGGRTTTQGYSQFDGVRQKFTSKERDGETGLDYFLARYYSSAQGRFTSPDDFKGGPRELWVLGSGHPEKQALFYAEVTNPQSLNKYQYCFNNPLRYVDPDGQKPQDSAEIRMQQAIRDLNSGRITEQQYWERLRGAGVGAVAGVTAILAAKAGVSGLTAAALWATRNPQAVQQVAQELVQASSGNPTPANLGTPLTTIFNVERNALTSGKLLFGSIQANNATVAAQFSKNGDTLVAGIVGVANRAKGLTGSSIKSLINSVKDFARQEGLAQVEVQAIAVINKDLEKRLLQQGFQRTTVIVDGEKVDALTKTIRMR